MRFSGAIRWTAGKRRSYRCPRASEPVSECVSEYTT
ncbi:hypothetical protein PS874_02646 [Pseudomonas fluorescens]|nr:hypothetical protein PS874_02646 [Pseudomonas fluorescens]